MIIEPVQGEGGYNIISKKFLTNLREICTNNNIALIMDEVQSGIGRTGKFFAYEHSQIIPDITVFAKGIASGFPLSGIIANKKHYDNLEIKSMGGTYGANIISTTAAIATLDLIKNDNLI